MILAAELLVWRHFSLELRLNGFPPSPLLCIRTRQPNRPPPRNFFSPPPPFRSCVRVCFGERREKKSFVEWRRLHFCQHCPCTLLGLSRRIYRDSRNVAQRRNSKNFFSLSAGISSFYTARSSTAMVFVMHGHATRRPPARPSIFSPPPGVCDSALGVPYPSSMAISPAHVSSSPLGTPSHVCERAPLAQVLHMHNHKEEEEEEAHGRTRTMG